MCCNMMRSTKSQKVLVVNYNINVIIKKLGINSLKGMHCHPILNKKNVTKYGVNTNIKKT